MPDPLVEEARWRVLEALPFFSRLVLHMPVVATTKVPVLAVDQHGRLYYNPESFAALEEEERAGVVLHEVLHLALRHFDRAAEAGVGPGDAYHWNLAADLEVNPIAQRTFRLPAGAYLPSQIGLPPEGVAEEYYALLKRPDAPQEADGSAQEEHGTDEGEEGGLPMGPGSSSSAADGQARPWELAPDDPEHPGLLNPLVDVLIEESAREYQNSFQSGYGPFSHKALVAWAERILAPPQVDWRTRLRRWVQNEVGRSSGGADDYTFQRLRNRGRLLLPRTEARKPRLALVIDTSASMGQEDFDQVLAEVKGILRAADDVHYFAVDAAVTAQGRLRSLRRLELRGGGATDMGAGIRAALEAGYRSIVVLTDGGTGWPRGPERGERVMTVLTQGIYGRPPGWIETIALD
ncbi:hypothetical protein Ocepr_2286 (plasmid) [Oceanithermus profundus DSM 14977]|uniref:Metallopeptidase domain-containing protein n=1 Tax=Oceanithermus profundus (strain DSM 14977 / NBRC 100410 / VKM B-2274 / 506) TaxID=670487 RepID=E4UAU9_OCEP5|nr:VWA-like domain-containing protein [Oceanithermus profundus]ADR37734.1 hypothetical protein Ocepr_2286 [Oceanithermus profundus DSM 14977]